ncbi:MAG: hypothetical protein PVG32_07600 [Anaerolineales bacterium]
MRRSSLLAYWQIASRRYAVRPRRDSVPCWYAARSRRTISLWIASLTRPDGSATRRTESLGLLRCLYPIQMCCTKSTLRYVMCRCAIPWSSQRTGSPPRYRWDDVLPCQESYR